jgi:hypothetical protein
VRTALRSRLNSAAAIVFALAAVATGAGCGYHFAASGDNLPRNARTIYVARFANRTRTTGVNDQFMPYLKDEIALHKRLVLVDSPAGADLELSGSVTYVNALPTAFNSVIEPTIYSQGMSVSAQLMDLRTHKVLWSTHGVSNVQHDPVVSQSVVTTTPTFLQQNLLANDLANMTDIQVAQAEKSVTHEQVMQRIAQNLYSSMSDGF